MESATSTSRSTTTVWTKSSPISAVGRSNFPKGSSINDTADEELPLDVEHLLVQKSGAAQWGAAVGAIWRRPGSVKDVYQLRENALVAAERLAKFLTILLK